jgi:colicin import membrane protein
MVVKVKKMATLHVPQKTTQVTPPEAEDPFAYGWRELFKRLPDGEWTKERVPLTLKDILHPQVRDFQVHSYEHEHFGTYLHAVLTAYLADDHKAVVLHDTRVAWEDFTPPPHTPNIAVIFNVRERCNWNTFDTAKEGTKPSLIIEITSPGTRNVDLISKVNEYAEAGVPYYVIVDTVRRKDQEPYWRLLGYRLENDYYVDYAADERGWLWLEPVRLWLALEGNRLVCYDETGRLLEDYGTILIARAKAEAQVAEAEASAAEAKAEAAREAQARAAAEARIRQLEAALREFQPFEGSEPSEG